MSGQPERRLVSLRRRVAPERAERYATLWAELAGLAGGIGAHAWRFVSAADGELALEFLEFKAAADPRRISGAPELLARLDREIAPAEMEEWLEGR